MVKATDLQAGGTEFEPPRKLLKKIFFLNLFELQGQNKGLDIKKKFLVIFFLPNSSKTTNFMILLPEKF